MESQKDTFFVRASEHLGITLSTGKWVKNPKKSANIEHILIKGHDARLEQFSILLKENNKFEFHLKEFDIFRAKFDSRYYGKKTIKTRRIIYWKYSDIWKEKCC